MRGIGSSRAAIAALLSTVLVVTLLSPVDSAVAAQVEFDPSLVPPLVSEPAAIPVSEFPEGDFTNLGSVADIPVGRAAGGARPGSQDGDQKSSFDEVTSQVSDRTEYTTVYLNDDGTHTTRLGSVPVNAKNDKGDWVPISNQLVKDDESRWSSDSHPLDPSFGARADDENAFEISRGGYEIGFTLEGANASSFTRPAAPRQPVSQNSVVYPEVFKNTDLTYEVSATGVKESLILRDLPTRSDASWVWRVKANALDLNLNEGGGIDFVNRYGEVKFQIPRPIMWDSSGVEGKSESALINVATKVWRDDQGWAISMTPDYTWLSDPARVFPVTVDPTVYSNNLYAYGYKSDGNTDNSALRVGNTRESGLNRYWRSIVLFDFSPLAGKQVLNAGAFATYTDGTTSGATGSVFVANCFGFACNGANLGDYWVDGGTGSNQTLALRTQFAKWVREGQLSIHLMFTGTESDWCTYKTLWTSLTFDWKDYPSVSAVVAPSPANGATKAPMMPTFKVTGTDPGGTGPAYQYKVFPTSGSACVETTALATTNWSTTSTQQIAQGVLSAGVKYCWRAYVKDGYDGHLGTSTVRSSSVRFFTTNAAAPLAVQSTTTPASGTTATTLTPTLTAAAVTDADGDPVTYQFRVASGSDGKSGAIVSSGWLASPTWTVPPGTLQDGGAYTWVALTSDSIDTNYEPLWVNRLTVNLRLGTSGPSPFDSAGPVTVNLANGNAALSFTSPTVNTVGGPMGLSFAYNSQQSPTLTRGLTGSYFNALNVGQTSTTNFDFTGRTPLLVRTDPAVSFQWGLGSPAPSVANDYFLTRWTGFITVPAAGSYSFGVDSNDGMRTWVNSTKVLDSWSDVGGSFVWGAASTLNPTPIPFQSDYYEDWGSGRAELWVRAPDGPDADSLPDEFIVPPDWFSTTVQTLPAGWAASSPIAGGSSFYVSARVSESSIVLTDATGSVHTYPKVSTGGYSAPTGEYGTMSLTAAGLAVLSDSDGTVYSFGAQGQVLSATPPADALKPATPPNHLPSEHWPG